MTTVDERGRPRGRLVHPVWEEPVGWLATGGTPSRPATSSTTRTCRSPTGTRRTSRSTPSAAARGSTTTPSGSASGTSTPTKPEGYPLEQFFRRPDHPEYGLLRLEPWRIELWDVQEPLRGDAADRVAHARFLGAPGPRGGRNRRVPWRLPQELGPYVSVPTTPTCDNGTKSRASHLSRAIRRPSEPRARPNLASGTRCGRRARPPPARTPNHRMRGETRHGPRTREFREAGTRAEAAAACDGEAREARRAQRDRRRGTRSSTKRR